MDDIRRQLSDPDQAVRLAALTQLRKQALKGAELADYTSELLPLMRTGEPAEKTLLLKVAENYIKHLPYQPPLDWYKPTVELLGQLYLQGLQDKLAAVRKAAIYGLDRLLSVFHSKAQPVELLGEQALGLIADCVADSGCDLDENDLPTKPKGTLTIAAKAETVIGQYPNRSDFAPVFYALIPALERLHFLIYNHYLEEAYGQKLVDSVIEVMRLLVEFRDAALPVPEHPEVFPHYLVELISFTHDSAYKSISDTTIYSLLQPLVRSKAHNRNLVEVLELDEWLDVKIGVLQLLRRKIEHSGVKSLNYFIPRLQAALTPEKIDQDFVPEAVKQLLSQENH